jgi:hypothetical protein
MAEGAMRECLICANEERMATWIDYIEVNMAGRAEWRP